MKKRKEKHFCLRCCHQPFFLLSFAPRGPGPGLGFPCAPAASHSLGCWWGFGMESPALAPFLRWPLTWVSVCVSDIITNTVRSRVCVCALCPVCDQLLRKLYQDRIAGEGHQDESSTRQTPTSGSGWIGLSHRRRHQALSCVKPALIWPSIYLLFLVTCKVQPSFTFTGYLIS